MRSLATAAAASVLTLAVSGSAQGFDVEMIEDNGPYNSCRSDAIHTKETLVEQALDLGEEIEIVAEYDFTEYYYLLIKAKGKQVMYLCDDDYRKFKRVSF